MPNYAAMDEIMRKHADLIIEQNIPQPLLNLSAHIAGYKAVVAAWEKGDFTENFSFFNFPNGVRSYLRDRYLQLKKEQAELLLRTF